MTENVGAMERTLEVFLETHGLLKDALRAAVLAFLDLSQAEIEAVTTAANAARDRLPPEELWFDLDETNWRVDALRALAQENPNA